MPENILSQCIPSLLIPKIRLNSKFPYLGYFIIYGNFFRCHVARYLTNINYKLNIILMFIFLEINHFNKVKKSFIDDKEQ